MEEHTLAKAEKGKTVGQAGQDRSEGKDRHWTVEVVPHVVASDSITPEPTALRALLVSPCNTPPIKDRSEDGNQNMLRQVFSNGLKMPITGLDFAVRNTWFKMREADSKIDIDGRGRKSITKIARDFGLESE
eukprot:6074598-Pyramimonas_sp.AAC.1